MTKKTIVYVVEVGYDYEGSDAVWAGTSAEEAFAFANPCTNGDELIVTRWDGGRLVTKWWRRRGAEGWNKSVLDGDTWKDVSADERSKP
jgi:hypothetical protein